MESPFALTIQLQKILRKVKSAFIYPTYYWKWKQEGLMFRSAFYYYRNLSWAYLRASFGSDFKLSFWSLPTRDYQKHSYGGIPERGPFTCCSQGPLEFGKVLARGTGAGLLTGQHLGVGGWVGRWDVLNWMRSPWGQLVILYLNISWPGVGNGNASLKLCW